eukprot:scaffold6326_cov327-Prasinococcus_capsulatus_cf.AAC.3
MPPAAAEEVRRAAPPAPLRSVRISARVAAAARPVGWLHRARTPRRFPRHATADDALARCRAGAAAPREEEERGARCAARRGARVRRAGRSAHPARRPLPHALHERHLGRRQDARDAELQQAARRGAGARHPSSSRLAAADGRRAGGWRRGLIVAQGKPESYVAICIADGQDMIWAGSDEPCALGTVNSLGAPPACACPR